MIFWASVTGLILIALAFLLLPLLRAPRSPQTDQRLQQNIGIAREKKQLLQAQLEAGELDQAGYDSAFVDLQTSLALDLQRGETLAQASPGKWMSVLVLLLLPLLSLSLYFEFGEYRVVENPQITRIESQPPPSFENMSLDEMVVAIKARLRDNPEDARGWYMLGRTLMALQQFDAAVTAFQRTHDMLGDDPEILFSLADALAMQNDGNLLGEPEQLVQRGLKLAPRYPNGLWLAGLAAEQRKDYKAAHHNWNLLLPLIADNQDSAREIGALIAMLEQRDPSLAGSGSAVAAIPAGGSITLAVDIDAALKAQAQPGDAVFVYAKAMQGPPMPLAVKRLRLADLPTTLTLSDADAMMPSMKLSSFDQVIVGARVSRSGNPVAQSGDFYTEQGSVDNVNPPASISLLIDQVK